MFTEGRLGHPILKTLKKYRYAHRGYHNKPQIPENSLPAFRRAIDRGWGAELDVHILKDGTLVVMHDSDTARTTGAAGILEDMTLEEVRALRLEGTDAQVPLFDEVLELFENTTPLIIELKTCKNNHLTLTKAVLERLDRYKGVYCIESFDPRCVEDVKRLRPEVCRGQLSDNSYLPKDETLPLWKRRALINLYYNIFTKPDFVAYKFEDRANRNLRRIIAKGVQEVHWTIRSREDMLQSEKEGAIVIFEKFDPDTEQ